MAQGPDPLADADYRSFLDALAREGLLRRTEAARATEAVACALALRLREPDYDPVRELLPEPFKGRLLACERHREPAAPPLTRLEEFLTVTAEDMGVGIADAERAARAVFHALREELSEEAEEDLGRRLPADLLPLWTLTS